MLVQLTSLCSTIFICRAHIYTHTPTRANIHTQTHLSCLLPNLLSTMDINLTTHLKSSNVMLMSCPGMAVMIHSAWVDPHHSMVWGSPVIRYPGRLMSVAIETGSPHTLRCGFETEMSNYYKCENQFICNIE